MGDRMIKFLSAINECNRLTFGMKKKCVRSEEFTELYLKTPISAFLLST
jgi:hypothetical protein